MNESNPQPRRDLDPERLERGLEQLRQLGYLHAPAAEYVARRVGLRRSVPLTALLAGLWVGGGAGLLFALLLSVSAVAADPGLLGGGRRIIWLWLDLSVVLCALGILATAGYAAVVLVWNRRAGRGGGAWRDEIAMAIPGILSAAYLMDRVGRTLLVELDGGPWWLAATGIVVVGAMLAGLVSGLLSAGLAIARTQARSARDLRPRPRGAAWVPMALAVIVSVVILARGPYQSLEALPYLDEVEVIARAQPEPVVLVAIDGAGPELWSGAARPAKVGIARASQADLHPIAYWNEIATGFVAAQHGLLAADTAGPRGWAEGPRQVGQDPILGLVVRHLLPGVGLARRHASDRRELRRPPVWEILARGGRRARVINWWGSYPAAQTNGLEVVSERFFLRAWSGDELSTDVAWPPEVGSLGADELARIQTTVAAFREHAAGLALVEGDSVAADLWNLATAADYYHLQRAVDAVGPGAPELVAVLLNGGDLLQRGLARHPGGADQAGVRAAHLDYLRALMERFVPLLADDTVWLAVREDDTGLRMGSTIAERDVPDQASAWGGWLLERAGLVTPVDMQTSRDPDPDAPATYGRARRSTISRERSPGDLERLKSLGYIGN